MRSHTDQTRSQLALWDRAVDAARQAGIMQREIGERTYYDDVPADRRALDAATSWLIASAPFAGRSPLCIAYGGAD